MLKLDIQYFADDGASAVTGGSAESGTTESAADSVNTSEIEYGIQETEASAPEEQAQQEEVVKQSLKDLLKNDPDLKAQYDAEVGKVVKRRLKAGEATQNAYNSQKPIMAVLAEYYGKDESDIDGIADAVKNDNTYFKKKALNEGKSADEVKDQFWMMRKNRELSQQIEEIKQSREREKTFAKWDEEIPKVKELYPEFDMDEESANPQFMDLAVRYDVRTAYEVTHRDEINTRLIAYAQNKGAQSVADTIAANKARPTESALSPKSSRGAKIDVDELTLDDMKEIRKRVRAGAKIRF